MQYHLIKIDSDIVEDVYEEGEGASTGAGLDDEKVGRSFPSLAALVRFCHDAYGMPADLVDYEEEGTKLFTSRPAADHSQAQNGGWFEPTDDEYAKWKQGKIKLYLENYTVHYLVH